MKTIEISLPNSPDNFILVEMCERLKAGHTVTMLFGGVSMLPLINGGGDKIQLRPLAADEQCKPGEVYLFFYQNHYIIHRLMNIKDGMHNFRGDNCVNYEHVTRDQVLAKLIAIEKKDGTLVDCESDEWRRISRKVVLRRTIKNILPRLLGQQARRRWSVVYFVLLAILMWAPLNGVGLALNNYIFGLRLDHLLHASVYLFCPLFLADWLDKRAGRILAVAVLIGLITESVQALLPFRGFDINDLVANCLGNLMGWLAILPILIRHQKLIRKKYNYQ